MSEISPNFVLQKTSKNLIDVAKVQIKSETIATFGGIFHIMDVFERLGMCKLIDSSLGKRDASWNAFQYSELFEALFCNYLCGGGCLEDINMLAPQFSLGASEMFRGCIPSPC